jgi:hypothetical protein
VDTRDTSILTQVAFKEAGEQSRAIGLNLLDPNGQAQFEQVFSYLTESLFLGVRTQLDAEGANKAGELVRANFPGTIQVAPGAGGYNAPQAQTGGWQPQDQSGAGGYGGPQAQSFPQANGGGAVGPHNYQITVKDGKQFGPLPEWLYPLAAADNVHEVYDNRDQPPGSRRPLFKSTSGGRDAPAYWAPGR